MNDVFVLMVLPDVAPEPGVDPAQWFLSDQGRYDARALATHVLWEPVERLYTGPEMAAQETAQVIASVNGIGVTVVEDLVGTRPVAQIVVLLRRLARYDGGGAGAVVERGVADALVTGGQRASGSLLLLDPVTGLARLPAVNPVSLAHRPCLGDE